MVRAVERRGTIRLDDPRRKGVYHVAPKIRSFEDFAKGFCEYAETKTTLPCPECGQQVRCNTAVMQENYDVIGLFECRCGHSFKKRVKADELRRKFAEVTGRDTREYDSSGATVAELEDKRRQLAGVTA